MEVAMPRRMTIVFDDEALYTALKVEAARTHRPAKDIVADALHLLFEATPDEHAAILDRVRSRNGAPVDIDRLLAQLGLRKDADGAGVR
jgi:hypothetical protein